MSERVANNPSGSPQTEADCRNGHDERMTLDFDGEPIRCIRCKAPAAARREPLDVERTNRRAREIVGLDPAGPAEHPSGSPQTEADQPLDSFLADAGLAFDDIPVAMAIHHRALAAARREPLDVERLLRDHQPFASGYQGFDEFYTACSCGEWDADNTEAGSPEASWTHHFLSSIPAREEGS